MHCELSPEDVSFIKTNYLLLGPTKCSAALSKPYEAIRRKARHLGLTRPGAKHKKPAEYKVNPEIFSNPNCAEAAYILGLLWADGYLKNTQRSRQIVIECVQRDVEEMFDNISQNWRLGCFIQTQRKQAGDRYHINKQ
jgi:DNA-binding transcriptional regulator WhiA